MVKVGKSPIAGEGLFADQFIPEGTIIGDMEGYYTDQDSPHTIWIEDEDGEIEGFRVTNEMRYINHADEPNAAYYDDLTVVALRDIQPGEEITHDYRGDDDAEDVDVEFAEEEEAEEAEA